MFAIKKTVDKILYTLQFNTFAVQRCAQNAKKYISDGDVKYLEYESKQKYFSYVADFQKNVKDVTCKEGSDDTDVNIVLIDLYKLKKENQKLLNDLQDANSLIRKMKDDLDERDDLYIVYVSSLLLMILSR